LSSVVVFGSINLDITTYLERRPVPGETIVARDITLHLGGKGANQSVAVSKLGIPSHLIGAIGKDAFGADVKTSLSEANVICHLSELSHVATGVAVIDVADDGSNDIRISAAANGQMTPEIATKYNHIISNADVLLLQHEVPLQASLEAARIARAADTFVIMDPAPAPANQWPREVLAAFDLITPNTHEVRSIIGWEPKNLDEAQRAAKAICEAGSPGVIVTAGEFGVAWYIDGVGGQMVAPKVVAVDTVAAGDCFNGALAASFVRGASAIYAIEFACHAGALATTRSGASQSAPELDEVLTYMSKTLDNEEQFGVGPHIVKKASAI